MLKYNSINNKLYSEAYKLNENRKKPSSEPLSHNLYTYDGSTCPGLVVL